LLSLCLHGIGHMGGVKRVFLVGHARAPKRALKSVLALYPERLDMWAGVCLHRVTICGISIHCA
jgi:hypothetical protein